MKQYRRRTIKRIVLRLALIALTVVTTALAGAIFGQVVLVEGWSSLDAPLFALFIVLFFWIAFGFWTATVGFFQCMRGWPDAFLPLRQRMPEPLAPEAMPRTALAMPIYNEDPARVAAGLRAMREALQAAGYANGFDFFLLSDTTDPDIWLEEEQTYATLANLSDGGPEIYYRRRPENTARKSGNIEDFCRRWGGEYRYMIVLDADSVLAGPTVLQMVTRMEQQPRVGLLQVPPKPVNRTSWFARMQQFAASAYGELFNTGLSLWTDMDGNYYGHNAIIRIRAFMDHCGLPKLPGRPPLGGEILSHDFVEAALMRRAGWRVQIADDLGGSFEECPTTLIDFAKRDQRWCQGNMQHFRLIFAYGFHPVSRIHLGMGVMSFVASPLWLAFMLLSIIEVISGGSIQSRWTLLAHQHWLIPMQMQMALLFVGTLALLFLPKLWAFILLVRDPSKLQAHGGEGRVMMSIFLEALVSALMAPIMMAFHVTFVLAAMMGRKVQWKAQRRGESATSFAEACQAHKLHMLGGIIALVGTWVAAPQMVVWILPIVVGLIFSIPISIGLSSVKLGQWLKDRGVFLIPEEVAPPPVLQAHRKLLEIHEDQAQTVGQVNPLARAAADPALSRLHLAGIRATGYPDPPDSRGMRAAEYAITEGPQSLSNKEKLALLTDPTAFQRLHRHAWQSWPIATLHQVADITDR